jgi:hypothetical protein
VGCARRRVAGPLRRPQLASASSSRTQVSGQAARAVAGLTSGVVSTVVHQCPWLVVAEVTQLVTRHHERKPRDDHRGTPLGQDPLLRRIRASRTEPCNMCEEGPSDEQSNVQQP